MIALILSLLAFSGPVQGNQPDSLTLKYCYEQAVKNYPEAKNIALQEKITGLNIRIANTGHFPQVSVNGRASYQSEVTEFGLPRGGGPPAVSKDQYEASIQVNQNIYNGGVVGIQRELARTQGRQEVLSTEVALHQVRSQVDQVYFGILLSRQQMKTLALLKEDLEERLLNVRTKVENGVLLNSQKLILEAELIKISQDSSSVMSNIKAGYAVLGELIGEELDVSTEIILPKPVYEMDRADPARPELALFENSRQTIDQQKKLAQTKKLPKISAYGTAAYGRPGLNFLNDDFHDYYMVGLKINWKFIDFLNSDEEEQMLNIQQQKIQQNEASFHLQLNTQLSRISERIGAIEENIIRDEEIIDIREQVVEESARQMENGVITATEYITELNNANRARLYLFTNRIKLIQAQTEYRTAMGLDFQ